MAPSLMYKLPKILHGIFFFVCVGGDVDLSHTFQCLEATFRFVLENYSTQCQGWNCISCMQCIHLNLYYHSDLTQYSSLKNIY